MSGLVDAGGNPIREESLPNGELPALTPGRLLASALYDPEKAGIQISTLLMDAVRQNDRRPASVRFACPDHWAQSLAGDDDLRDVVLCVRIARSYVDALLGVETGGQKEG